MKVVTSKKNGLLLMLCLFLAGCSNTIPQVKSGFLGDYSQLQPSTQYDNTSIYQAPGFDLSSLAAVTEIKLEPFEVWIKQSQITSINREQLLELHSYFHRELAQALAPDYQMVTQASENTLTIRGAFSGVKLTKPGWSVLDVTPFRIVINSGNAAYLMATAQRDLLSEVSIEAEFLIGTTPNRAFAMTASKKLDVTVSQQSAGNVDAVTQVLDVWVEQFVEALAKARESQANQDQVDRAQTALDLTS